MPKKFITLSLNPAIDRTMYFDNFTLGTLNRTAGKTVRTAGSKGMNAARALKTAGSEVLSVAFCGGDSGGFMRREMEREGIPSLFVTTECEVRENVKIIEADGRGTEANERGGPILPHEIKEMYEKLVSLADENTVFLLCGSIPPGVETSAYRTLTEKLKSLGASVALDCDGAALKEALNASPDLIKPNKRELEGLVGRELSGTQEVFSAAKEIAEKFFTNVLCTLGEDGSLYVSRDGGGIFTTAPKGITVRGFAGAGDTYLGIFCHHRFGQGESVERAMTCAASASAAKVECEGSNLPSIDGIYKYVDDIRAEMVK